MNTKARIPKKPAVSEPEAAPPAKPARAAETTVPAGAGKPRAAAKRPETADDGKSGKIKMVRDSFTMPEMDYSQLDALKKRCLQAGVHVKKSELLRAGLLNLAKLPDSALIQAVEAVEKLKTGRPAKA